MARLDWYIQEAVRLPLPYKQDPPYQLSLALFPCLEESLGFLQVCHMADAAGRVISHQCRMYYREEFELCWSNQKGYVDGFFLPETVL